MRVESDDDDEKIAEHRRNMGIFRWFPLLRNAYLISYIEAKLDSPVFSAEEKLRHIELAIKAAGGGRKGEA